MSHGTWWLRGTGNGAWGAASVRQRPRSSTLWNSILPTICTSVGADSSPEPPGRDTALPTPGIWPQRHRAEKQRGPAGPGPGRTVRSYMAAVLSRCVCGTWLQQKRRSNAFT